MDKLLQQVRRKFRNRPPPIGCFPLTLTPSSYLKVFGLFDLKVQSPTLYEIGCGQGTPMVFAALYGFQSVLGIDIDPTAVQYSRQVVEECRSDPGFADLLSDKHFQLLPAADALTMAVPESVTHVLCNIAWTNTQFPEFIALMEKYRCEFAVLVTNVTQRRAIETNRRFAVKGLQKVVFEGGKCSRTMIIVSANYTQDTRGTHCF